MIRNEDEGGKAEVVWTYYERPRVCRKKDKRNEVTRKEEKRGTKEKICRKLVQRRQMLKTGRFEDNTLWLPLIERKGRKKKIFYKP